jgi:Cu+-exporting ATPase
MSGNRPERVLDPVCGMTVEVAAAEAAGRTLERDGRTYAFCRDGCLRAFLEEPEAYAAGADRAQATASARGDGLPIIDAGMRAWYESCSCCLSDAYPDVKAALDAERAANAEPAVPAGICEVAEATEVAAP